MGNFTFLKIFNSPFKRPKIVFYMGRLKYGTPIFFPRRWIPCSHNKGYVKAVPKKIGFDFVDLGYKTKWSDTDYRFEWNPIWSFVLFKLQICVMFTQEHEQTWTSWLYYENNTDKRKTKEERIKDCIENFPQKYQVYSSGSEEIVDYYNKILK